MKRGYTLPDRRVVSYMCVCVCVCVCCARAPAGDPAVACEDASRGGAGDGPGLAPYNLSLGGD